MKEKPLSLPLPDFLPFPFHEFRIYVVLFNMLVAIILLKMRKLLRRRRKKKKKMCIAVRIDGTLHYIVYIHIDHHHEKW